MEGARNIFDDLASAFNIPSNVHDDIPNADGSENAEHIDVTINQSSQPEVRPNSRQQNKRLRMEGKAYNGYKKSKSGKHTESNARAERNIGDACNSPFCAKSPTFKCNEISEDQRKNVFELFWNTMNWEQRRVYVSSLVDVSDSSLPLEVTRAANLCNALETSPSTKAESLKRECRSSSDSRICWTF